MEPMTIAALTALLQSGMSAVGNASQGRADQRLKDKQQQMIDELLGSLDGSGKYGFLFRNDPEAFQTSFVDPANAMFRDQVAPQIQQGAISSGLQKSSNLDDQLMRAGVDMDQMLNQSYMQFQNQGKDRAANALNTIFGQTMGQDTQANPTTGNTLAAGASGFFGSDPFSDFLGSFSKNNNQATNPAHSAGGRQGFTATRN